MKAIKKIDPYKRIRIPADMQNKLGWKIDDQILVETSGDKIILTKVENESETILDDQDDTKDDTSVTLQSKPKDRVQDILQYYKVPTKIDLLDDRDELNDKLCPKCRKPIEYSRFKFNGNYLCKDCRDKIRDTLYLDISKRLEEVNANE